MGTHCRSLTKTVGSTDSYTRLTRSMSSGKDMAFSKVNDYMVLQLHTEIRTPEPPSRRGDYTDRDIEYRFA